MPRVPRSLDTLLHHVAPLYPASRPAPQTNREERVLTLEVQRLRSLGIFDGDSVGQLIWEADAQGRRPVCFYCFQGGTLTVCEVLLSSLMCCGIQIDLSWQGIFDQTAQRPWLTCPIENCHRQASKLYILDGGATIACRDCLKTAAPAPDAARVQLSSHHEVHGEVYL